jgi:hypothetical protein
MKGKKLTVYAVLFVALTIVGFLWIRHRDHEKLLRGPDPVFVVERIAKWRSASFITVSENMGRIDISLRDIEIGGIVKLDDAQATKLHQVLESWLRTYAEGTWGAYQEFRLSRPYDLDFTRSQALVSHLEKYDNVIFPKDGDERLKVLWERKNTMELAEVALETMALEVRRVEAVASEADLIQSTSLKFMPRSQSLISLASPIVYRENPATIIGRHEPLVYCIASVVFRLSDESQIFPVTALFYWSDRDSIWYPWHLAFGQVEFMDELNFSLWF